MPRRVTLASSGGVWAAPGAQRGHAGCRCRTGRRDCWPRASPPAPGDLLAASVGPDGSGKAGEQVLREALGRGYDRLLLKGPIQHPRSRLEKALGRARWQWQAWEFETTCTGEALYRKRWALLAWRSEGAADRAAAAWERVTVPSGPLWPSAG